MITAIYNITIYRGITFDSFIIKCYEDDALTIPKDITNWKVWAEIRTEPDGNLIYNLNPSITNAAQGEVTVPEITDEQTILLLDGKYKWDFTMEDPGGERRGPFVKGSCIVKSKITQGVPPE